MNKATPRLKFVLIQTLLTIGMLVSGAGAGQEKQATYTNPLNALLGDPFIFHEGGVYYLYGTEDKKNSEHGIPVLTSTDLVHWEDRGYAFKKDETTWTQRYFWGAEIVKVGNEYYMYYTASPNKDASMPLNMHINLAKGKSPLGPFKEFKAPFYKPNAPDEAIDPNVFIDDDGKAYFSFTQVIMGRNDIRIVKLKDNLIDFDGEPILATVPSREWENRPWKGHLVNEGSFMLKHNGYYYLTYSANPFMTPYYAIGYATSKSPLGPWEEYKGNPVLSKTDSAHGPGNGMFIKSPDGSELFIVYHTHFNPGQLGPRKVAIDRVRFQKAGNGPDTLIIDGPTTTPQPMPLNK